MDAVLHTHTYPSGQILELVHGDLTLQPVDAIVNAANASLQHGGGLAAAIVARGGEQIQEESDAWVRLHGSVPHNEPAITTGGRLACKYIIHAVGPVWGSGDEDTKLAQAVYGSLEAASRLNCRTLAIPPISTGIFGFPKERAARIILAAIASFFEENPVQNLQIVRVTIIDQPTLAIFTRIFTEMHPAG